ncbi:MAG TPA: Rho termination factor N-terminal domain-containing protein [Conexibacter sp.]|jgi:transcription termination factor Rho|nr:Rho termination factor N-terminal domain-containing protein [Conexibacter sp.]
MPVLERSALADSPLADLHAIASEIGIDGFRRLRKEELIDAIVARQGGDAAAANGDAAAADDEATARPRRRRGGRGRAREEREEEPAAEVEAEAEPEADAKPARRERGGRGRDRGDREERPKPERDRERGGKPREEGERTVEGVVELAENGSGFLRVGKGGTASDDDVYVSAAQVRRCELVDGDRVGGPVRPPRRSERFPSLVRVDTINGRSADEVSEGVRFDELPAAFPTERFAFGVEDETVSVVEFLTPIGRGSRVTIAGAAHSGKSETLRRLAEALAALDAELETSVVLAGARPEEIAEWREGPIVPAATLSFAATGDAQAQAVERAVEQGKRVAARGGHAVVLIDTLEGIPAAAARKALAAARNIPEGGSLTVIATASAPIGGETTVVALDAELAGARRYPAIDLLASRTLRPELLVGEAGAAAIAEAVREQAE